jgi:voltage-gated potassium channel
MVAKSIRETQLGRDLGVIILAIREGDGHMQFNPPADTAVRGGDYLIVMGKQESLHVLENLLAASGARK